MQEIDYSALGASRSKVSFILPKGREKLVISGFVITTVLALVPGDASQLPAAVVAVRAFATALLPLFILIGIVSFMLGSIQRQSNRMNKFAENNGWQPGGVAANVQTLTRAGFTNSWSRFNGVVYGHQFWAQRFSDPADRNGLSYFESLVFELRKPVPTIFISKQSIALDGMIAPVVVAKMGLSRFGLEGNFNKTVDVFCEPKQQQDALTYLTPDVMAVIADHISCSVIYVDKYIVLTPYRAIDSPGTMKTLFFDAHRLLKEINEKQR